MGKLSGGEPVNPKDFSKFNPGTRGARIVVHPVIGSRMVLQKRVAARFTPGRKFKEKIVDAPDRVSTRCLWKSAIDG